MADAISNMSTKPTTRAIDRRISSSKMLSDQPFEQRIERFAIEGERRRVGGPRELVAAGECRYPDLPDRRIRAHHELRLGRLLEQNLQHAVLQLDLELLLVRDREERLACPFECIVCLHAEFLFAEPRHPRHSMTGEPSAVSRPAVAGALYCN